MKLFLFVLFIATEAFALEAVVTVLEAPMFQEKSINSPVVQYLRKGDIIRVHPSLANSRKYDDMAHNKEKLEALDKQLISDNTYYLEDEFIPTVDRQGKQVYVLSEHIYVYFNDTREFGQTIPEHDPTDYRLEEPLPPNYPLLTDSGHRGQFLFGLTSPYLESYPYPESAKSKGYTSPVDFNVTVLRKVPYDLQDRFYFGGSFNFRSFNNSYSFFDNRSSKEQGLKFGIGPYISYDAYKGEKNRLNIYGSIIFYFFNQLKVTQSNDQFKEERNYRAFSLAPKLGFQYHRKKIFENADFVLGTSIEIESPSSFKTRTSTTETDWWRNKGEDKFTTNAIFSVSGYLGIQSSY